MSVKLGLSSQQHAQHAAQSLSCELQCNVDGRPRVRVGRLPGQGAGPGGAGAGRRPASPRRRRLLHGHGLHLQPPGAFVYKSNMGLCSPPWRHPQHLHPSPRDSRQLHHSTLRTGPKSLQPPTPDAAQRINTRPTCISYPCCRKGHGWLHVSLAAMLASGILCPLWCRCGQRSTGWRMGRSARSAVPRRCRTT